MSLKYLLRHIVLANEWDFRTLKSLLDLHPHLISFIEKVKFYPSRDYVPRFEYDSDGIPQLAEVAEDPENHRAVPPGVALPLLPNVTKLSWHTTMHSCVTVVPATLLLLSSLPAVTQITFSCRFSNVCAVEQFLKACGQNVGTVKFKSIQIDEQLRKGSKLVASFSLPKLRRLFLLLESVEDISLRWLQIRLVGSNSLTSLTIKGEFVSARYFEDLINHVSSSLQELQVEPPNSKEGVCPSISAWIMLILRFPIPR
jgi:hypothetical protein